MVPVNLTFVRAEIQRFRWLGTRLPPPDRRRIVVITGARQTGKTTLARRTYPTLRHVNLDAIEEREALRAVRTRAWGRVVGPAVVDEVQKEPTVFDKVKYAYDEGEVDFTVLLGSSRLLLLSRIQESLAGRAFLYDLHPLMASEIRTPEVAVPDRPLLDRILRAEEPLDAVLGAQPEVILGDEAELARSAIDHLAAWGGMPELLVLDDDDRRQWLRSYQQTWLERDLADLARLHDLQPFRTLQRLAMLRSGRLLSYSDLARDAAIGVTTARRYLEYLRISYQVFLLPPYHRNLTSSIVKAPKLYWLDLGLLRHGTGAWGPLDGEMFETLVVGEIHKWVHTMALDTPLAFYRTRSGMEVDLLATTPRGLLGIEVKNREAAAPKDLRVLRALAESLGGEWTGGLVVTRGGALRHLDRQANLWEVPLDRLV
jgi:uncharacterized protein